MDTILHADSRCGQTGVRARRVPMPYADRLASHLFLGDMVVLGVKAAARRVRDARWPAPLQHVTARTCTH